MLQEIALIAPIAFGLCTGVALAQPSPSTSSTTTYHSIAVGDTNVFYRAAGPRDAPTLLLLHGYPSSSRMFDTLIPLLADRYHIVAPDYPGFGHSDAPPPSTFAYTFDQLADVVGELTEALALDTYALYLQDYGGPVGFRLALAHPERVKAFVIQNAVAYEEGLGPAWEIRRAYWKDRAAYEDKVIPGFMSFAGARERHIGSSPHPERYNPDTWTDEFAQLSRPGQAQIQADLFYDYQSNVASYPKWKLGCVNTSRQCWWSGAGTIRRSPLPARRLTSATCPTRRSTSWTPAILRSTKKSTKSLISCVDFSRNSTSALRRALAYCPQTRRRLERPAQGFHVRFAPRKARAGALGSTSLGIAGTLLLDVLNKPLDSTFVVIEEVEMENWGWGGLPVEQYRRQRALKSS